MQFICLGLQTPGRASQGRVVFGKWSQRTPCWYGPDSWPRQSVGVMMRAQATLHVPGVLDEFCGLAQSLCRGRKPPALHRGSEVLGTGLWLLPPRPHSLEGGDRNQLVQIPLRHDELVGVNHFDAQLRDDLCREVFQIRSDDAVCVTGQCRCQDVDVIGIGQLKASCADRPVQACSSTSQSGTASRICSRR